MGYDAYQLIAALFSAQLGDMLELDGATGQLYLDPDGRVHRRLAWAQFQRGEPVPMPELESQSVRFRTSATIRKCYARDR